MVKIKDLAAGTKFNFGSLNVTLLEPSTGYIVYAYHTNNGYIIDKAFDKGNVPKFNPQNPDNIAYYLNNTFLNTFDNDLKDLILQKTWNVGRQGYENTDTVIAKIGLLSESECKKYIHTNADTLLDGVISASSHRTWTRTPDTTSTKMLTLVSMNFWRTISDTSALSDDRGVAWSGNISWPTFYINPDAQIIDGTIVTNVAPNNVITIQPQSTQLGANKSVNLASYFVDPDGDTLTFTASSSNTTVGTVTVSGSILTLRPVALGSTTITVTANDGKGGTKSTTFTFSVVNSAPTVSLTSPSANQTLYENDVFNISGTTSDGDSGNSVTIRYQINANTVRAIRAFVSDGSTVEAFSKTLTFKSGSLYDGDTLIAGNLADGVAHKLKVWATDDQGGQSVIVERDFYVVPNRAPRLEVTPPTIEGNIDSDTFTVSGTYADDDKNEVIISYRINGSISKEVARGTDGTFDFTLSLAQLKNGNNTISVEAIDSYGAKTSRTIKLNKNTIATPLLQSTVRYLIQPPRGSAQAVLLWLQRDQELAVTASLHMGMKGEAEAFTLLEPTNTAPLRDNAAILEDEFYHEADSAKDHIILQLDMKRSSVESTAAIHLISGVFE